MLRVAIREDKRAIREARERIQYLAAELSRIEDELRRYGIQFVVHP